MRIYSLNIRIISIFILMLLLTLLIEAFNLTYLKLPELYALEAQSDQKDILRIKSAFNTMNNELAVLNYDNAVWDAAYDYLNHNNDNFIEKNFILDFYTSIGINGIYIYDQQQEIIWSEAYNSAYRKTISLPDFEQPSTEVIQNIITPSLTVQKNINRPITHSGLIELDEQLLQFAATAITKSNFKVKNKGTLVFWRFVDDKLLSKLKERAGLSFTFTLVDFPESNLLPMSSKGAYVSGSYRTKDDEIFDFYPLANKNKLLRFSYRAPPRQFQTHLLAQSLITMVSLTVTFLIVYLLIHYIIIRPIMRARELVKTIIDNNDRSVRFISNRTDELGTLFGLMNRLLEDISSKEQELISHNTHLQEISRTDGLTNIANRRAFDLYIHKLLKNKTPEKAISLLFCDVDYFKKYNDCYGHAMGDKALRLIAENLQRNLHAETDFVARYGGEEFVIVLNNTNQSQAESVANNLILCIKQLNISHDKSDIAKVITISIGSHTFMSSEDNEYTTLFEQADKALYLAKNLGQNRACSSALLSQF